MAFPYGHPDPACRCMPFEEWPAADRRAWQEALSPGDLLDPGGRAAAWSPLGRRTVERGYGRYLTFLMLMGQLVPNETIAARLRPVLAAAYVEHLRERNAPQTVVSRLGQLAAFAAVVIPMFDRSYLRRWQARLRARGLGPGRKAGRVRHSAELAELGFQLIERAEQLRLGRRGSQRWLTLLRDGLLIGLLALRPLRLRNLTALRLGEHLVDHGADGWWLLIPGTETKNKRPIEMPFPDVLLPALHQYLGQARPVLQARSRNPAGRTALWLSLRGSPLSERGVHEIVARCTLAAFGRALSPHLFRHAAATTLAVEDPEQVRIAGPLLGHATFATSERYYRMSRSVDAAQVHHKLLATLRQRKR